LPAENKDWTVRPREIAENGGHDSRSTRFAADDGDDIAIVLNRRLKHGLIGL
jgi:hypothetical protein